MWARAVWRPGDIALEPCTSLADVVWRCGQAGGVPYVRCEALQAWVKLAPVATELVVDLDIYDNYPVRIPDARRRWE
ncbi:hypothetical protein RHRU231_450174 [Rhodococcus ruber]|uniref:Uncharacterized protein n=1 Tax=Rhodococcus ruber TaxID=1830 RepID=A0A098BLC8_9NOCA|nr:hypothetical protein RHRU231_450174 [Rhodococcus ruber]